MAKEKEPLEPTTTELAVVDEADYFIWRVDEPDGETTYHMELNNVTFHFYQEEWGAFLKLVKQLDGPAKGSGSR